MSDQSGFKINSEIIADDMFWEIEISILTWMENFTYWCVHKYLQHKLTQVQVEFEYFYIRFSQETYRQCLVSPDKKVQLDNFCLVRFRGLYKPTTSNSGHLQAKPGFLALIRVFSRPILAVSGHVWSSLAHLSYIDFPLHEWFWMKKVSFSSVKSSSI